MHMCLSFLRNKAKWYPHYPLKDFTAEAIFQMNKIKETNSFQENKNSEQMKPDMAGNRRHACKSSLWKKHRNLVVTCVLRCLLAECEHPIFSVYLSFLFQKLQFSCFYFYVFSLLSFLLSLCKQTGLTAGPTTQFCFFSTVDKKIVSKKKNVFPYHLSALSANLSLDQTNDAN